MRLIDAEYLKNLPFERMIHTDFGDTAVSIEEIDNAPTVEPCYQTTSCSDCKMYDKEKHNCPRFCEVISDLVNEVEERPKGEWKQISPAKIYECSNCHQVVMTSDIDCYSYCHHCGADMRGGRK